MAKPHIVLLPGAWHSPECYSIITPKLEEAGYTVHSAQLPAVGNPNPPKDLSEDVSAVRELVTKAIGEGNDVVVVPHSWSGIVTGSALGGFGKKVREAKGEKGGVTTVAYMCAFIVPEGVSLLQAANNVIPPWYQPKGDYSHVVDVSALYNELPPAEQEHWKAKLQSHAWGTQIAPATGASWKEIPTNYLLCEDDQAIPAFAQEAMSNAVKEADAEIVVERLKAGHSPFLNKPDEVVAWIRKAAGEKI